MISRGSGEIADARSMAASEPRAIGLSRDKEKEMATALEIAQAAITAWNAHDLSSVAGYYRPDVTLVSPDGGEQRGHDQAAQRDEAFMQAFPDFTQEVRASYEAADTAIIEWVFSGTNTGPLPLPGGATLPATGKRVSVRGADFVTVADGAVASLRSYYDQVELLTQLGLMPEPPGA
jgi:steroid delta-isomerase-like uncharacterized protein